MESNFDKIARFYNLFFFQFYYFFIHNICFFICKQYLTKSCRILDIACGTGLFLGKIKKWNNQTELFGIDNSAGMIKKAKKSFGNINFCIANAEKILFQNKYFDFITIIDALYYFQNQKEAIKECQRVLKPGGFLFIHHIAGDIFPKFLIRQIKIISKFLFFNIEKNSIFKDPKKIIKQTEFKIIINKNILMHRFILMQKL